ncbi:MAG: DeoR/GlpR family DNA-binding transcription regulator [Bacillota bacterium]|jgi:DeoR/GlpR family transcriptional regulator of sugar metabolism
MNARDRRVKLLEYVKSQPITRPAELASALSVSAETIRRDLGHLLKDGLIAKTHGGVVAVKQRGVEIPYAARATKMITEKRAIGRAAARLIEPGDCIIIEGGTTAMELVRSISHKDDLMVATQSIEVAMLLEQLGNIRVFLLGGWVRGKDWIVYGNHALHALKNLHVDKAFIGGAGLSLQHGLTDYFDEEVNMRKCMIEGASETVLMVDHSKFDAVALLTVAPLTAIDVVVTDSRCSPSHIQRLKEAGIRVIVAEVDDERRDEAHG